MFTKRRTKSLMRSAGSFLKHYNFFKVFSYIIIIVYIIIWTWNSSATVWHYPCNYQMKTFTLPTLLIIVSSDKQHWLPHEVWISFRRLLILKNIIVWLCMINIYLMIFIFKPKDEHLTYLIAYICTM